MFHVFTYGFDWTHKPHKEDLERDSRTPERFRFWKKFQYIRTAKRFGEIVHVETITVYTRTEHIFNEIIRHWNALGNSDRPLNPGLTWHYVAVPEPNREVKQESWSLDTSSPITDWLPQS